jgi:hypothetical protein
MPAREEQWMPEDPAQWLRSVGSTRPVDEEEIDLSEEIVIDTTESADEPGA